MFRVVSAEVLSRGFDETAIYSFSFLGGVRARRADHMRSREGALTEHRLGRRGKRSARIRWEPRSTQLGIKSAHEGRLRAYNSDKRRDASIDSLEPN